MIYDAEAMGIWTGGFEFWWSGGPIGWQRHARLPGVGPHREFEPSGGGRHASRRRDA